MHRREISSSRRTGFGLEQALAGVVFAIALLAGCGKSEPEPVVSTNASPVRGGFIRTVGSATNAVGSATNQLSEAEMAQIRARPDATVDGYVRPGFDKLSAFKYELYEFYSETNSGRAMLASHDTIPPEVKVYDGKRIVVTGYVLPMRTRRGVVTEFLLLRDQGTCCFGVQAQINHFIRVTFPAGIKPEEPVPWKVSGTIRVGEIYIQGYLTGIFQMDADSVVEQPAGVVSQK